MARKIIDIGTVGNDGTGDSIRDSFRKVNDNFRELYSSLGLGERLKFIGLEDAPSSYVGQNDPVTSSTPFVTINNTESGLAFKHLRPGTGVSIDFVTNPNEITINSDFAEISADTSPQLGGDLSLRSGGNQWRVIDAGTSITPLNPIYKHELVNKAYADSKVARAGVNAINPESGQVDPSLGRMSGPLILSRDPEPDDDINYDGLIAATKRYVDNAAFGSTVNLYVATSGADERNGVAKSLQGRALAYAYRTLEAALKRAEELVNEANVELGPYKKVLTYNNNQADCTLTAIHSSPASGNGFVGSLRMSVDTVTLNSVGTNYYPGDILQITGGTIFGGACFIQVLSTLTTPGSILTYKVISSGSYSILPGATGIATTISSSAAPEEVGPIGVGATFDLTYKVNSVSITNGGTGYSLVSVRISGGGGSGAFGTAVVEGGAITSISITDKGKGFTSLPSLNVDLPRFLIYTAGYRTDYTGDVTTGTPEAIRGRDIREGLYLRGETSGALAQILSHQGELDSEGNEIFDVDIKFGAFILGETISYGDISKNIQISILVESGEYYENYPLKVPTNVSIVGDEFRRIIFRPRPGTSSSPWAFQYFRRDTEIDGLQIATQNYGYHYLQDSTQPVYPKIDNKGDYRSAAALLELNRIFLQEEIIAWMNRQIDTNQAPFTSSFSYDNSLCKRDVGLLVDSFIFDLKYGGYNRTISAGLKYYQSDSSRIAITTQLSQYLAVLAHLENLMLYVITNTEITAYQTTFPQIIDPAYQAELGSNTVISDLIAALTDVIDGSGSVNYPKENQEMDVFLANDAVRWQAISAIGHGGFMGVLDPEGQILSRSPYFQECASFSRSQNRQVFAGGMFADGFAGNLEFVIETVVNPTRLAVSGLDRFPQLPCSFIVGDSIYRVNYIRDYQYNKDGSTATFVLDETTPWPYPVFTYNEAACERDVGLILDGLGYDIALGTNYWTRINGLSYRMSQSAEVIANQRSITVRAIDYAHQLVNQQIVETNIKTTVTLNNNTLDDIIDRGVSALPTLTFALPATVATNVSNAYSLLMNNRDYIVAEVDGWIQSRIAGNISPWATGDTYNAAKSQRDTKLVIEAVIHDLIYGGNAATRQAALKYYNNLTGELLLASGQPDRCASAIAYASYLAGRVVLNLAPAVSYSALSRVTGSAASAAEATTINGLLAGVAGAISAANYTTAQTLITLVEPTITTTDYSANNVAARLTIQSVKPTVQTSVINFVNKYGNRYELIMPGNRSMLANDYTQINDMGYGAIAANGGLMELVSVFTYYCYISYYSLRGGQIRSVSGSSSHGIYALVAEGADPLEVPTPTTLWDELQQRVDCYFPSPSYANTVNGLFIYVTNYNSTPLGGSELEINHSGIIYRYPVTSVATSDLPPGVARLNLTSSTGGISEGLFAVVPNGTKMTLRQNNQVKLTGDLADVAVRPSTGLKLRETESNVYRVLQFTTSTDENGPYEVTVTPGAPGIFKVLKTITTISSNVCTTQGNHKLTVGDKFIPTSTANGLVSGTTYYVISVPAYNQFKLSTAPGGASVTLTDGTGLSIKGVITHKLLENYTVSFSTTGTLPAPLSSVGAYYVLATDLTDTEFTISTQKNGTSVDIINTGSGVHSYSPEGLTITQLRENYNYIDLTIWNPGEYTSDYPTGRACSISNGPSATITLNSHGFVAGDVIKFTTSVGGSLPIGMSTLYRYFVISDGLGANTFKVSPDPAGVAVDTSSAGSGTFYVGKTTGRLGDDTFAVVGVGSSDIPRVAGSKFVFLGEEYTISTYQPEGVTNQPFARVVLNRPLVDAINNFPSSYTIKSGVAVRTSGSLGTLTIRISLTRVTSHDLLEIGTGSYADTNYPKEIYGASVNPLNPDTETEERDVGRVFYVTTDQYGNFKVGPYFAVDQGTGQVTFSSSIALSNLDGIGFKRGVPVAEFSTDSAFTDNATDTVPTENAARIYIERRLGLTHDGSIVPEGQLIPTITGGYMALNGLLAMKGNMDLGDHNIINVSNPVNAKDVVNLQSLTFNNFQETVVTSPTSGSLLAFTGTGNNAVNVSVTGDITATRTGNSLDLQINANTIVNNDINAGAAIAQSKLAMNAATTRASATGITQADRGLSSFSSSDFDVTDGWVSLKANSVALSDITQIASKTVLGNSTLTTGNVTAVDFGTVVDSGLGIKKSQYNATGFLRRTSSISNTSDADYSIIESAAGSSANVEANKLIIRDVNGDFGGRTADLQSLKIDTQVAVDTAVTATGGYIRYYGYNSAGGVLVSDGTLAADKKTAYWNDLHQFKTQNGVSDAPVTCSSIQTLAITTGLSTTAGTITGRWTLTGTSPNESRLQATYSADLAENYEGDKEYEVGTVLVFGGDKEVTTSSIKGDTRVAGVVSNTAAYTMYEACPGFKNLVALQGRVPCKVVGKIRKGDILITSGIPGVAVAASGDVKVGTVVGKALGNYDSNHIGTLEIAVGRT